MATDWLITGAGGQLGSVLLRLLAKRGAAAVGAVSERGPRPEIGEVISIDLTKTTKLVDLVRRLRPQFILHTAAVTNVNDAFRDPDHARLINFEVTERLKDLAEEIGARLVFTSTDLVFNGIEAPYRESDATAPTSIYGATKAEAELALIESDATVILRLPLMFGVPAVDRPTTFMHQVRAILDRRELTLFGDEFRTPIWLEDAARACVDIAQSDFAGVLHAGGPERLSRLRMGELTASAMGIHDARLRAIAQCEIQTPEPRPVDVSLDSSQFESLMRRPAGIPMAEALKDIADELNITP
ncbi:MAG TPA: SDR family oxidoreductase [Phycisphaerae bacterium]|nr:SDR family oxidoreductase [Phycisphaerae bacterium]HRW55328.1 SDR family oxidoreductase [Phycisphaerae bacterium]